MRFFVVFCPHSTFEAFNRLRNQRVISDMLLHSPNRLVRFVVEECQPLAAQLGIRSVPTTMIFTKGALVDRFAGEIPKQQLKQVMQALIGKDALRWTSC